MQIEPSLVPVLSALAGALIGSATTVITLLVQTRSSDRRARREFIAKIATEERAQQMKMVGDRPAVIPPVAVYLSHFEEITKLVENGKLTPENLLRQIERDRAMIDALELDQGRRQESAFDP